MGGGIINTAKRLTAVYKDRILVKRFLYDHTGLRSAAVDAGGLTNANLNFLS